MPDFSNYLNFLTKIGWLIEKLCDRLIIAVVVYVKYMELLAWYKYADFLAGLNSKEVIEKELLLKNIDDEYEAMILVLTL